MRCRWSPWMFHRGILCILYRASYIPLYPTRWTIKPPFWISLHTDVSWWCVIVSHCPYPSVSIQIIYIYIYLYGSSINGDYPIMTYFPIKMDDLEIPPWNGKPPLSLYKLSHFYYSTIYIYIYIYHYKLCIYIYISPLYPHYHHVPGRIQSH